MNDYFNLVGSLKLHIPVTVHCGARQQYVGVVRAIEAEDGSGKCWNIRLLTPEGETVQLFVRTT